MSDPQVKRPATAHSLACCVEEFMQDNRHSRDVDSRWLAHFLTDTLQLLRQARADKLDDRYKQMVAEFRLGEIEKEQSDLKTKIEALNREARTLVPAP